MIIIGGEALVDLVDGDDGKCPVAGGGPFNTAVALGRLGVDVAFLGALGRDTFGQMLERRLIDADVDTSLIRHSRARTPTALVEHGPDGNNTYTFDLVETAFSDFPAAALPELPATAWAVHVGTLALAIDPPAGTYEALIDREAGRRAIIVDPNIRPLAFGDATSYRQRFERLVARADIVKLSEDDAAWLYPGLGRDGVLDHILEIGARIVAVTLGPNGAVAAIPGSRVSAPGIAVEVVDTVGAGDSFGAALIAALVDDGMFGPGGIRHLDEDALAAALAYAVAASAITCTRSGANSPTRAEVAELLAASADTA